MTHRLVGREAEVARLDRATSVAAAGRATVVAVRGEVGLGKTALLRVAVARAEARGLSVLPLRGRAADAELAFSSLLTLLRPLDDRLDDLAGARAPALRTALALDGHRTDPIAVRLAVLEVVTRLAADRPLVLALDDAPLLDRASAEVLAFVLGRLDADAVLAIMTAVPDQVTAFDDVVAESVELSPLPPAAAALLDGLDGLAAEPRRRCVDLGGGNPLATLAVVAGLAVAEREGTAPLPAVPRALTAPAALLGRLDGASTAAQRVLVVVAADDTGDRGVVVAALGVLGEDAAGLDAAEAEGLLAVDGDQVDVAHPLLRPLAYHRVAPASRRAAHRALATALAGPTQGASRAWQLVAAADGPDEELARSLDLVAVDATRRGATGSAARTLACAAALSPSTEARRDRLVLATQAWLDAGDGPAAAQVGAQLLDLPPTVGSLAAAALGGRAHQPAAELVGRLQLAAATVDDAGATAIVAAEVLASGALAEAAEVAARSVSAPGPAGRLARAVRAEAGVVAAPVADLSAVGPDDSGSLLDGWAAAATLAACVAGGHHAAVLAAPAGASLALGGPALLAVVARARARLGAGDVEGTLPLVDRLAAVVPPGTEVGATALARFRAEVALLTGAHDEAWAGFEALRVLADDRGLGLLGAEASAGLGRVAVARAEPAAALPHLRRAVRVLGHRHAADLAVAAAASGLPVEAERAAALLGDRLGHADPVVAMLARVALGVTGAPDLLPVAVEEADRAGLPLLAVEVLLAMAEVADRAGDVGSAVAVAAEARRRAGGLRITGWAARLAAVERPGPSAVSPGDVLSPAERRVAVSVAEGGTNKAVAASLFLSVKTVDFHLQNIYRKLEVRSRTELAVRLLRTGPSTPAEATR